MTYSEKIQKADSLANQIGEMVRQIQRLEKELIALRVTDIYHEMTPGHNQCSLWSNLELSQTRALTHRQDLGRFEEDPCFSSLALLEDILGTIPQSVLQMQGCYIRTQDKNVAICVSFSTSVEKLAQMHEYHLLRAHCTKL